jgi:hypothetical protein
MVHYIIAWKLSKCVGFPVGLLKILGCLPMHNLRSAERDKDRERKRLPEA